VYDLTVAHVDGYMVNTAASFIEEKVSRLDIAERNCRTAS
jgi:hypothetical protein